jgi:peptide/nickel transport system permease protein
VTGPVVLSRSSARVEPSPSAGPTRGAGRPGGPLGWLRREAATAAALIVLGVLAVLAVTAPLVGRYDPLVQDRQSRFEAPSLRHPFGTDEFGRDLWSRAVHGARVSLLAAAAVVLVAGLVGVPLGLLGGYAGGWTDTVIMRFLDFLLAVPAILLAMAIIAVLGPGVLNAVLAVAVVSIPAFARIARASTLALKEREFVLAARAMGGGPGYLMFRTILPNAASPLLVQATVAAAYAILLEAALSFLGLSARPPQPSWGSMLNTGRSFLYQAPWYGLFPGVMITLAVLSLNGLADGLQRAFAGGALGAARPTAGARGSA